MPITLTAFEHSSPFQLPFKGDTLKAFKAFLQKMWHNKRWRMPFEKANIPLSPFFKWEGGWAVPQNYVGFIKYQDCIIELYPKLFLESHTTRACIWKHLFFYLSYAQPSKYAWEFVQGTEEEVLPDAWTFYQMMCLVQIEHYLSEDIYQSYETSTALLPHLKGRIDIQTYTAQALAKGKWQQIAVRHTPLVFDNPLNQLLKFILLEWQTETPPQTANHHQLSSLLQKLDNVSTRHFTLEEALAIRLPGFETPAQQVLEICIYFLENQMASLGSQQHQNFVWLLPMERVYERFIFGFLRKHFPAYKVQWQNSTYLATASSTQRPALRIQPDIYLPELSRVLDAKYKLPSALSPLSILPEDAYQMIAYCLAKQAKEACLIYPVGFGAQEMTSQSFEIQTHSQQASLILLTAFALQLTSAEKGDAWRSILTKQLITQFEEILG